MDYQRRISASLASHLTTLFEWLLHRLDVPAQPRARRLRLVA
jgi:hypothetical protein